MAAMKKAPAKGAKSPKSEPAKKPAKKTPSKGKMPPFILNAIEKKEEREHKDLDHDGEKGEPKAHQRKVLGYSKEQQLGKKPEKKSENKGKY